jgi:imidazolonepropionase-like amidohydrolase
MRAFRSPYIPEVEEMRRKIVADMQRAGVGLLAGTDMGEVGLIGGFSLHEELVSLQSAGLTPLEALQTATINPAIYQNATDSLGTIEQGKIADLILLNENPLENIDNTQKIEAVFTNGMYLNRKDLDSLLLGVETYIKDQ